MDPAARVCSLLSVLLLFQASPQAPRDQSPDARKNTAILRGQVVAAETGKPQPEAIVTLAGAELNAPPDAITDEQGRFQFEQLPAGRFLLNVRPSPHRSGFLPTQRVLGAPRSRVIDILQGQTLEDVRVTLDSAGVISGQVFDDTGEPLSNVQVSLHRRGAGGAVLPRMFGMGVTDDRGHFRIADLEPADYFVRAQGVGGVLAAKREGEGYLPTYFPSTPNPAEASEVTVGVGQERIGIDIRLSRGRVFRLNGIVLTSNGSAAAGARLLVAQLANGRMVWSSPRVARPDGTFELRNLAPADYVLSASQAGGPATDPVEMSPPVHVTIAGTDVDNLTIAMSRGVTLSGHVVTEDGAVPSFPAANAPVQAAPAEPGAASLASTRAGVIRDDWTFQIRGVVGACVIRLRDTIPGGWRLRAVFLRSADITDEPTPFPQPTLARDLKLVISNRGASLSGTVTDASGRPAVGRSVVLFPVEPDKRSTQSLRFRTGKSDAAGRYRFDGLPAGDYLVGAYDETVFFEPVADARAFAGLESTARRVSLRGEDARTLDVRSRRLDDK